MFTLTFKPLCWALEYCDEEGLLAVQVGPLVLEYSY